MFSLFGASSALCPRLFGASSMLHSSLAFASLALRFCWLVRHQRCVLDLPYRQRCISLFCQYVIGVVFLFGPCIINHWIIWLSLSVASWNRVPYTGAKLAYMCALPSPAANIWPHAEFSLPVFYKGAAWFCVLHKQFEISFEFPLHSCGFRLIIASL